MPGSINSIAPPCVRLTVLQHNSADTALRLDYRDYSACLSRFLGIQPLPSETIATDGKVLRGSYEAISDDPTVDSHPAIILLTYPSLKAWGFFLRRDSDEFTLRKHLDRMPYGCKSSHSNYLRC